MGRILLNAEFYGQEELHDKLTPEDWKMARTIMDNLLKFRVGDKSNCIYSVHIKVKPPHKKKNDNLHYIIEH